MSKLSELHGRVSGLSRHRRRDDPELVRARSDLAELSLQETIKRAIEKAPPLTAEQRSRLAVLLLAPAGGD
jgi:hypothetical protein